jgi:hypothetical protein
MSSGLRFSARPVSGQIILTMMFPRHILRARHRPRQCPTGGLPRRGLRHNVWTNALLLMFVGRGVGGGEGGREVDLGTIARHGDTLLSGGFNPLA